MSRYDAFLTVLSYCVWASKRNKRSGYFNKLKIGQKHLFAVFSLNTLFSPQQLKNKKGLIPSNFVEEVAVRGIFVIFLVYMKRHMGQYCYSLILSLINILGYDKYIKGYDQYMKGYDQYINGYDKYMKGYDQYINSYDKCMKGYDQYINGYDKYLKGY